MNLILEGYKTKLTNIYKDKEHRGHYTIELKVEGIRFHSTATFVRKRIMEVFDIGENEFNELLNK